MSEQLYRRLLRMDATLSKAGVPPLSDAWKRELKAFYCGGYRLHAARVGRGASKSTTSAKCLLAEVLYCQWKVPPGERHWAIAISENIQEAKARLVQIAHYLTVLGIPHTRSTDQILLDDRPLGFWVRAASIGALSGPRAVAFSVEEAAKVQSDGSNPAAELVNSLTAASITHPEARGRVYSSPFGASGYHYDLIEAGMIPGSVYVTVGATWEFAPWLTEEMTRLKEPNPRIWAREYAAIPSADGAAFDADDIARAYESPALALPAARPIVVIDASSGRGDAFAWAVATRHIEPAEARYLKSYSGQVMRWGDGSPMLNEKWTPKKPYIRVGPIDGVEGKFSERTDVGEIVRRIAALAKQHGTSHVFGDQREAAALTSMFRAKGLTFRHFDWNASESLENEGSKSNAVETVRRWLRDGELYLAPHEKMKRELIGFPERFKPNGKLTYGARGVGKDDYVSLLITLAMVDNAGLLPKSQAAPGPFRGNGYNQIFPF